MSAQNRAARHQAVCGDKPGGADAYYLKEHCAPKNKVEGIVRPRGNVDHELVDYKEYCAQQVLKLQKALDKARNRSYTKELREEAVNGIVLVMLSYACEKAGKLPFSKRLRKAMREYNALMERHDTPELKAHACMHLSMGVMQLLHFHYTGVTYMLSPKVRQKIRSG